MGIPVHHTESGFAFMWRPDSIHHKIRIPLIITIVIRSVTRSGTIHVAAFLVLICALLGGSFNHPGAEDQTRGSVQNGSGPP